MRYLRNVSTRVQTATEWANNLQLPGPEGGFSATILQRGKEEDAINYTDLRRDTDKVEIIYKDPCTYTSEALGHEPEFERCTSEKVLNDFRGCGIGCAECNHGEQCPMGARPRTP